jgi:hypothetical protein
MTMMIARSKVLILNEQGEEAIHVMEKVMFVVPGLEGAAAALEPLCRRLKIKVCGLQLGVEHRHETLQQMVERLHQVTPTNNLNFFHLTKLQEREQTVAAWRSPATWNSTDTEAVTVVDPAPDGENGNRDGQ